MSVNSVSDFLECLRNQTVDLQRDTGNKLCVYRGEIKIFSTSGQPNLFRGYTYEKLNGLDGYEKNILDEVISNGLSGNGNYLQAAMNAQHGGFPSRLLDFSFNSLIALFFAVTPHYSQRIDKYDDEDGVFIVYTPEKLYSSNSIKLQNYFKKIIDPDDNKTGKDKKIFYEIDNRLRGYTHKFIDYSNINQRMKAQQGGFILFSGNQFVPISNRKQRKIIIKSEAKAKIRKELKELFGLTMGSVYPESDNLVGYLSEKAEILVDSGNDLDEIYLEFNEDLQFYRNNIYKILYAKSVDEKNLFKEIMRLEIYVEGFLESFIASGIPLKNKDKKQKLLENYFLELQEKIGKYKNDSNSQWIIPKKRISEIFKKIGVENE